jgi:hypothetical protein
VYDCVGGEWLGMFARGTDVMVEGMRWGGQKCWDGGDLSFG